MKYLLMILLFISLVANMYLYYARKHEAEAHSAYVEALVEALVEIKGATEVLIDSCTAIGRQHVEVLHRLALCNDSNSTSF